MGEDAQVEAGLDDASRKASRAGRSLDLVDLGRYTQLRLARRVVADQRLPWEKPLPLSKLTPVRVLRSFVALLPALGTPAAASKPCGRSPGRPKGSLSGPAKRYPAVQRAA